MSRYPRRAMDDLALMARGLGYRVREYTPHETVRGQPEVMLDIEGNGELFEAYFARDPRTGTWCWSRGFRHVGMSGDRYRTLRDFRSLVRACADGDA